jgi:DNA (cytosine-5)-methyltransferase 1
VPDIDIVGYSHQRLDVDARDVGLRQRRLRHFQFGDRDGAILVVDRPSARFGGEPTCTATEGSALGRRSWEDFCELQGLPRDFDLPSFTQTARYRAVGNGVPPAMGALLARAIGERSFGARVCTCGCGRPVDGKASLAGAACRKRVQRFRDRSQLPLLSA